MYGTSWLVRRRASSRGLISDQLELLKLQVAIVYRYLYRVDDDARVPLHYALYTRSSRCAVVTRVAE